MKRLTLFALFVSLVSAANVAACSICDLNFAQRQPFTEDARQAKFVVYGTLANPRLDGERGGLTDLVIDAVAKEHAYLAGHPIGVLAQDGQLLAWHLDRHRGRPD